MDILGLGGIMRALSMFESGDHRSEEEKAEQQMREFEESAAERDLSLSSFDPIGGDMQSLAAIERANKAMFWAQYEQHVHAEHGSERKLEVK